MTLTTDNPHTFSQTSPPTYLGGPEPLAPTLWTVAGVYIHGRGMTLDVVEATDATAAQTLVEEHFRVDAAWEWRATFGGRLWAPTRPAPGGLFQYKDHS